MSWLVYLWGTNKLELDLILVTISAFSNEATNYLERKDVYVIVVV